MRKLFIILILSLSACHISDAKEKEMIKAKGIVIDYLNKNGKHNLVFDAEHSFQKDSRYYYSFKTDFKINGRFAAHGIYMIQLDSNLSKVISCIPIAE